MNTETRLREFRPRLEREIRDQLRTLDWTSDGIYPMRVAEFPKLLLAADLARRWTLRHDRLLLKTLDPETDPRSFLLMPTTQSSILRLRAAIKSHMDALNTDILHCRRLLDQL